MSLLSSVDASSPDAIGWIALRIPPVPATMCGGAVFDRFSRDQDLVALAVVDNDAPVGLVNRTELLMLWSSQFGQSLFAKKPIAQLMDQAPLIVDAGLHIDRLQSLIVSERPSALMRGFIITLDGRYFGIGTALSLLQHTVALTIQRNHDLEQARAQAEAANTTKSRFLTHMSHELRTPLNAIIGFSDILTNERFGPMGHAKYADYARDIMFSGQHLLSMIDEILDMAKIEAGRMELHEQPVNLPAIGRKAVGLMRQQAIRGDLALEVELDEDMPVVKADPRLLLQILLNLLSNAIKFTPAGGGITVSIGRHQTGGVEIRVADTGIGIAEDDIQRVLTPFGQAGQSVNIEMRGTGLGLPVVRGLAELHQGEFRLTSSVGVGTVVSIILPASRVLEHAIV